MQPLARGGYDRDQVLAALTADDQLWGFGVELLKPNLAFVADISRDVLECTVERDGFAAVHGWADLTLARTLRWGYDRVRPYRTLSSDSARVYNLKFPGGVYIPTAPKSDLSKQPSSHVTRAWDQMSLLQNGATRSWSVVEGDNVIAQMKAVIAAAGLTVPVKIASDKADATVPAGGRVWPLIRPRTGDDAGGESSFRWITILNDLATMIGYVGVYADWDGALRSEPATRAIDRPVELTLDVDDRRTNIVSSYSIEADLWDAKNRWVFYSAGLDGEPEEGVSQYTRDNLDIGPASQLALDGQVRQDLPEALDADSFEALKAAGDAIADAAIAGTRTLKTSSTMMPIWHRDVAEFSAAAAGASKWLVVSKKWTCEYHGTKDMTAEWEVVKDVA